jgi:uncharacterized protein DUF6361
VGLSAFGWTYLSRDALRRAEAQLSGESAGVRDEIGFLIIHQRYADRFFPGTSVLHTRLRYVLFVPWIYEMLRQGSPVKSIDGAVEQAEIRLAGRLLKAGDGVIGKLKHPQPTSQPPSVVYWTALGTWGLLRPRAGGRPLPRARVHSTLQSISRISLDDDSVPLSEPELLFVALPPAPDTWQSDADLDFHLTPQEAAFLSARLKTVVSPDEPTKPSLLARLAEKGAPGVENCWAREVVEIAEQDRAALARAGHAAALAAIGRGVYAAMVEAIRDTRDGRATSRRHRDYLGEVVEKQERSASRLDLPALLQDVGGLPEAVASVLEATLEWLAAGAGDPMELRGVYAHAEHSRKRQRARLTADLGGRERRLEWDNEAHTPAEPLHFRWGNVHRLISDLHRQP